MPSLREVLVDYFAQRTVTPAAKKSLSYGRGQRQAGRSYLLSGLIA